MEQTFFVLFFISVIFHNAKTRCNNGYYSKVYEHFIVLHKHPLLGFLSNAPDKKTMGKAITYLLLIHCVFLLNGMQ